MNAWIWGLILVLTGWWRWVVGAVFILFFIALYGGFKAFFHSLLFPISVGIFFGISYYLIVEYSPPKK